VGSVLTLTRRMTGTPCGRALRFRHGLDLEVDPPDGDVSILRRGYTPQMLYDLSFLLNISAASERRHLKGVRRFPHASIERQRSRRIAAGRHPLPRASGHAGQQKVEPFRRRCGPDVVEATDILI
jgi:hypothetical protein